jgi:single-strand DNA-binding protein
MANEASLTIIGNTTAPAELRFTASGHAVANVTVAHTPRRFDKNSQQWVDEETVFMDCTAWREMAENMAETLSEKGIRVMVSGQLKAQSWDDKQTGQKRSKVVLDVDDIGPSLRFATAQVNRTPKDNPGFGATAPGNAGWGAGGGGWG